MALSSLAAALLLGLAISLVPPFSALAQSTGQGQRQGPTDNNGSALVTPDFYPVPESGPRGVVSRTVTDLIVRDLSEARAICASMPRKEYVIDCLSEEFARIAAKMPHGDYAPAKQIIANTARALGALAAENRAPGLPRIRLRRPSGDTTVPLAPVRSDAVDGLNREAALILREAETQLLRSAESSERRMVHYRRIAAAAGSSKVLLRSL
ncbi:hypothetical protein [Rhodovulum euryhalinum]|uniref:Uncharacterized protein n=1 Tax=Rhodovulum euryhalinum TaxID=35805 RepID=A0A4R2KIY1_9RHOB|nr:hypothetical protein [Rhodovulum euryhalinum]TCO70516.1 hypothetical protein EV655_10963 [Rhodovulum euryhalinum]